MERLGALIDKLQEQFKQDAGIDKLTVTASMLLAELDRQKKTKTNGVNSKVSVVMPSVKYTSGKSFENVEASKPEEVAPENPAVNPKQNVEPEKQPETSSTNANNYFHKFFDPLHEVPTLSHQSKESQELNDVVHVQEPSLNDKLKVEKTEVVTTLRNEPIKDLRKAIGINDRYLFINDLFRGDETMYERSIKTINAFSILAEAEFWIQRELKLKLGWDEESDTVAYFDQLVRRRFS